MDNNGDWCYTQEVKIKALQLHLFIPWLMNEMVLAEQQRASDIRRRFSQGQSIYNNTFTHACTYSLIFDSSVVTQRAGSQWGMYVPAWVSVVFKPTVAAWRLPLPSCRQLTVALKPICSLLYLLFNSVNTKWLIFTGGDEKGLFLHSGSCTSHWGSSC